MSSYRFCRTDDIALLVDAWNRCSPAGAATVEGFKREIRELGVWCSSCMIAFDGADPIGVLIGCKRPPETLVLRAAVHPDHRRRGHARHLLTSLSPKLAILGPPRHVAEVSASDEAARALFLVCGWRKEGRYVDLTFDTSAAPPVADGLIQEASYEELREAIAPTSIPRSWERTAATLDARSPRLRGLVVAGGERVEASLVHEEGVIWAMSHERDASGRAALHALIAEVVRRSGAASAPRASIDDEIEPAPWIVGGGETVRLVTEARGA